MEDPSLLFGAPLLVFGLIGLGLAAVMLVGSYGEDVPAHSRAGWQAFVALAWFTVVEYIVAVETSYNLITLVPIAIMKVALIGWFFMHAARLRGEGTEE